MDVSPSTDSDSAVWVSRRNLLSLRQSFSVHPFSCIRARQHCMRRWEVWIHLQRLHLLCDSLVPSPYHVKLPSHVMAEFRGNRIKIHRALHFCQGFVRPPKNQEIVRMPPVGRGIGGIQREGSLKMLSGLRPVPIVYEFDHAQ